MSKVMLHANDRGMFDCAQERGGPLGRTASPDHYEAQYGHSFVEKWDALIDWDARAKSEGEFFVRELTKLGKRKVLDVATGTGFHSVRLLQAGFDVTSVDGSATMLAKAFTNARQHGHILRTIHADWRFLTRSVDDKYDAVICLGNSFTHLFSEHDRRRALAEFYAVLRHDGVLVLDQRNYDRILDGGYRGRQTYYYCGNDVQIETEHVDHGRARFRYQFADGEVFHLDMFPLRKQYMRDLFLQVGFQRIATFGDFQASYRENEPDFFVHVVDKSYTQDSTLA